MSKVNYDILLSNIFESFHLSNNEVKPSNQDALHLHKHETEKTIEHLQKDIDDLHNKIHWLTDTSKSIQDLSVHARVNCRPKMSKFVSIDALLNTAEYKLKYGDYTTLSSLRMTTEYCAKSIAGMQEEIAILNEHVARVRDQQMLAHGLTGKTIEVRHVDNGTLTVYDNGLVDIVESEAIPVVANVRKAKFRTTMERDKYLKNIKEKEAENTAVEFNE